MRVDSVRSAYFDVLQKLLSIKQKENPSAQQGLFETQKASLETEKDNLLALLQNLEASINDSGLNSAQKTGNNASGDLSIKSISSSLSSDNSLDNVLNMISMPDVSQLIQQVQNNPSQVNNIDSLVSSFLLNNYGGSSEEVIKKLTGMNELPKAIQEKKDQVFVLIVNQIAEQVRTTVNLDNPFSKNIFSSSYDSSSIR